MSGVNGVGNNLPIHRVVNQNIQRPASTESTGHVRASDKLELTGASRFLQALKGSGDIRADKVATARKLIESGGGEEDHKLNVAVDRLLDELNA